MSTVAELSVIIVAAGSGERFGERGKILAPLAGVPLLQHSIQLFNQIEGIRQLVVVLASHSLRSGEALARQHCRWTWTTTLGGSTRNASVRMGLEALGERSGLVAVHDAARPLATLEMVKALIERASQSGAAVPVVPLTDTVLSVSGGGQPPLAVDRATLRAVQTPQVARYDWLADALHRSQDATDEGSALLAAGYPVALVDGHPDNLKITWPGDLEIAELILARRRDEL